MTDKPAHRRIMIALADSHLLGAVFKKGLHIAQKGDTIVLVTIGDELAKRDGQSGHLTQEQIEEKLIKDFGTNCVDKGIKCEAIAHEKGTIHSILTKLTIKEKATDLVLGYSKAKVFGSSIAENCAVNCTCDVTIVKIESISS